jgi:hypothetical protein
MGEEISDLLNRVLTILDEGLPARVLAVALILIITLSLIAAIVYFRRNARWAVTNRDPYAPYKGATVNVNVAGHTVEVGGNTVAVNAPEVQARSADRPPSETPRARRCAQLRRIAALSGDDDEEFLVS